MSLHHDEGRLARRKTAGPDLYFRIAFPREAPEAAVGLLHGYADHSARYSHIMDAWAERGIATIGIDVRGHGRSKGPRGFCERFGEYLDDVGELLEIVKEKASSAPLFLFGHSFGGLLAATAAIADPGPWRGLILSAPYFDVALPVSPLKRAIGKLASRLAPGLGLASGLRGADLTHAPLRALAYDDDPLVFKSVAPRWYNESAVAQTQALARASSVTMPLYVVMGTCDRIAKLEAARAFFDAVRSPDKTWDAREGLFHEVLNEPDWPSVANGISQWMVAHSRL